MLVQLWLCILYVVYRPLAAYAGIALLNYCNCTQLTSRTNVLPLYVVHRPLAAYAGIALLNLCVCGNELVHGLCECGTTCSSLVLWTY